MPAEAKQPLLDADIEFDGVDFSNTSNEVTIEDSAAEHDVTGFKGGGYSEETAGLKTAVINIGVFQDYSDGSVHQTAAPLYRSGKRFLVVVKPDDDEISATNPAFVMVCALLKYNPVGAKVGDPQSMTLECRNRSRHGLKEFTKKADLEAFEEAVKTELK
jgi:hypothetical protein